MANTELPPVPYKTEMLNNQGFLTNPWVAWFRQIFVRVGGNSAPTNSDLLLNPMTTVGDMIIGGTAGSPARLPGNSAATKKFLTQTGNGSVPGSQTWGPIAAADVPTLNQNTTGTAAKATAPTSGSAHGAVTLDLSGNFQSVAPASAGNYLRSNGTDFVGSSIQVSDVPTLNQSTSGNAATATSATTAGSVSGTNVVTNSNLTQMAANTLKGNNTGSTANAADLTVSQVLAMLFPSGMISPYGGSSAPSGWLLCDGSAVSRTTFSTLFSAIGTTFGVGDGSTTFNVPNTKGLFLRGAGSQTIGGISYSSTLGATLGDLFQGHAHFKTTSTSGSAHAQVQIGSATTTNDQFVTDGITSDGTNGTPRTGAETRPANLSVNFIIKT